MIPAVRDVLTFWFGEALGEADYAERRKIWFSKNSAFDRQIHDRFHSLYTQAAAGTLNDWQRLPEGCLALLILLDQFPRNMFRGTAQSFMTDPQALAIAKSAIDQNFDQQLTPIERIFIYLPLEHSENAADQQQSVEKFRQLCQTCPELQDTYDYALRHQAVIDRFRRFPHRNEILDRESTPEEIEFLKTPGSSF